MIKYSPATQRLRAQKTALEKIGAHLEKEQGGSNAEVIRRMRAAYFADVDALEKSGEVQIPE